MPRAPSRWPACPQIQWSGTTTTGTASGDIWQLWVNNACSVATVTAGTASFIVWQNWAEYVDTVGQEARRQHRVISEEERARWRARERELEAQAAQLRVQRDAANAKAEELLKLVLTPQQREELARHNRFHVRVGPRRYRVDRGQHGNVKLLGERDEVVESYCIQPKGGLPDADAMAAQVLLLETDEATFLRVANVSDRNGRLIRHGAPQ